MKVKNKEKFELVHFMQEKLEEIEEMANELGIDDYFRNKKFIEVNAANILGHDWASKPYGADAYEMIGGVEYPTEYKAAKEGGSFQFHWLSDNKMKKIKETKNCYFLVTEGVKILSIYTIPTENILDEINEKATGSKEIGGHKSFSLKKLISLGAKKIY